MGRGRGRTIVCLALAAASLRAEAPAVDVGDLERFADRAGLVVVARCVSARSAWDDSGTRIMTTVEYEIERVVKGTATSERIVLEEHGGTVGSITQAVIGGPTFAPGERDLLFLVPAGRDGRWRTYALARGKLGVRRESKSGRDLVRVSGEARSERVLELDRILRRLEGRAP